LRYNLRRKPLVWQAPAWSGSVLVEWTALAAAPGMGPVRLSAANPRYFTDAGGKAILLTGSHTWGNLYV